MEKDPSLDFTSDQFDALKALYAKDLKPPSDEVRAYDNLAAYWAAVQRQSSVKGSDQAISSHDRPKTASALARSRKDVKINDIATTSARSINYEKKNKHREKVTVLERMQREFTPRNYLYVYIMQHHKLCI